MLVAALLLALQTHASDPAPAVSPDLGANAVAIAWLPANVQRWAPQIEAAAKKHGVDPDLVAIVVLLESSGDPNAVSPMGARGLMQVMPATAARLAAGRGVAVPTHRQLLQPRVSLDYGAALLAELIAELASDSLDALDGDAVHLVAAAYNGGLHCALAYVAGTPLPDETRRYATRVQQLWAARADESAPARK